MNTPETLNRDAMVTAATSAVAAHVPSVRETRSWADGMHSQFDGPVSIINVGEDDDNLNCGVCIKMEGQDQEPSIRLQMDVPGVGKRGEQFSVSQLPEPIRQRYQDILSKP